MSKFPAQACQTAQPAVTQMPLKSYVFGTRHKAGSVAHNPPTPASCHLCETRTNYYPHFTAKEIEAQEGTAMARSHRASPCGARAPSSQPGPQVQHPCLPAEASLWLPQKRGMVVGSWCPACSGCNKHEVTRSRGKIFIHSRHLGGCSTQPGAATCHTGLPQRLPNHLVCPLPPPQTSESSILPMQTLLPLTLSLTFCNHEILMTVIEFKVQFVSESFSGKGSCKGTVFKEMAGWRGRLGKPVLEWAVPGGCSRPPLPGLKLVWRGGL